MKALKLIEGTGTVSRHTELTGTLIDPGIPGDVTLDFSKLRPAGFHLYKGGKSVTKVVIPHKVRQNTTRTDTGDLRLNPLLVTANDLIAAINAGDQSALRTAFIKFRQVHKAAITSILQKKIGRVRVEHSGALVAVPDINNDAFRAGRFLSGDLSALSSTEVKLPKRVFLKVNNKTRERSRLKLKPGELMLISRWPTTDVAVVKVRAAKEERDGEFVIYVSPNLFSHPDIKCGKPVFTMDLVEGDNDGDTLNFNVLKGEAAKSELAWNYGVFESRVSPLNLIKPKALTWDMQDEPVDEDEKSILRDAIEQKIWIAAISLIFYSGLAVIARAERLNLGITVSKKEWVEAMTDALELCFDKKHNNASDPRPLVGFLRGRERYGFERVKTRLLAQGLNVSVFSRMNDYLRGRDIRKVADINLAFATLHGSSQEPPVYQLIDSVPEGKTLAKSFRDRLFTDLI